MKYISALWLISNVALCLSAQAWTPGPGPTVATRGLAVDTSSRADVVSFYQHVYQGSVGASDDIGWVGNIGVSGQCNSGRTSDEFQEAMERRINFYRAMAKLPSIAIDQSAPIRKGVFPGERPADPNTTQGRAAQDSALIMIRSSILVHEPPPSRSCYTDEGWNASAHGNLALGVTGPEAIDAYMTEPDSLLDGRNSAVGHRRWLLFPRAATMATGDIPQITEGNMAFRKANCLYVINDFLSQSDVPPPEFVPWPSAGYFPETLGIEAWSLSFTGADFRSASIVLRNSLGAVIPTSNSFASGPVSGVGDSTLVWTPSVEISSAEEEDRTYSVTVSNILIDGESIDHSYEVTFINPNRIEQDLRLSGNTEPAESGANFYYETVAAADSLSARITEEAPLTWIAGAEDSTDGFFFTDGTSSSYPVRSAISRPGSGNFWNTGSRAWRFTLGSSAELRDEAFIETIEPVIPLAGARVNFSARRGFMNGAREVFEVQFSTDRSVWTTIPSSRIVGNPDTNPDLGFVPMSVALPIAGSEIWIRLSYRFDESDGGGAFTANLTDRNGEFPTGIFIDDITLTNTSTVTVVSEVDLPPTESSFRLTDEFLGEPLKVGSRYNLNILANVGAAVFSSPEPLRIVVSPKENTFEFWRLNEYAVIGGYDDDDDGDGLPNGLEYALDDNPIIPAGQDGSRSLADDLVTGPGRLGLSRPTRAGMRPDTRYLAQWSTDLSNWTDIPVTFSAGNLRAETNVGSVPSAAIRWVVMPR